MTSLAARLRDVIAPVRVVEDVRAAADGNAADILGGEWRESGAHRFLVIDRAYAPGYRHGRVAVADALPPSGGVWPRLGLLAGPEDVTIGTGNLLFIDLETTGLAGGAGTYAFLVGCGWFEGARFRIRQFFLSSFAAEHALLDAVAEAADAAGAVVTFNGKTFDLPLIETRFIVNRMATPFGGLPHIDLLHPARRLWRSDDGDASGMQASCRLSTLEASLCGHIRDGDVPGFEIPGRYFHYVRSGDVRPLGAVLEHNRLDILSLAMLTSRAAQLLDEGPAGARTAREALGLGRLYERREMMTEARTCFERAATLPGDVETRADALRAYAVLSRRERRHEAAADAWRGILGLPRCPSRFVREATEALAVHHEHRLRDAGAARAFALQALVCPATTARVQALHHRLARLNRKLEKPAPALVPQLF
jgi:uncharacterized protein YprB with RNaseH-like and TPR domain